MQGCGHKETKNHKAHDYLTVILELKVEYDDVFEVYFAENIKNQYNEKDRLGVFVRGKNSFQKVVFRLPQRTYPLKLRIDLGSKGIESPIILRQIILTTGVRSKIIPMEELKFYFRLNPYLELGKNRFMYRKKIDNKYDPYLISKDLTKTIIELFHDY